MSVNSRLPLFLGMFFFFSEILLFFLRRCYNFHCRRLFRYYAVTLRLVASTYVVNYLKKRKLLADLSTDVSLEGTI